MRSVSNLLLVLVACAWLPLTTHCRLESAFDLRTVSCASDDACHGESHGAESNNLCCALEKSHYRSDASRLKLSPPDSSVILHSILATPHEAPAPVCAVDSVAGPQELRTSWQFSFRTALPVRAPSLAS
jgi:hypothetical protein